MHTKPKLLIIVAILVMLVSLGISQEVNIDLIISPTLQNARVVYISSFDLLQQGSADFLFQVTIRSETDEPGRLVFRLFHNEEPLAEATTNDFVLPAGIHNINNIQLSNGYRFPNGEFIKFDDSRTQSPDDDFEQETAQSGKLPGGKYNVSIEFFSINQQAPIGIGSQLLEVVSSAYVVPVAPGSPGGLSNPAIIYTEFPVFQFNTDLLPFGEIDPFNVRVYKVLPDQHQSVDDVLTTTPHLDVTTSWTLFQYPQNSADDQGGILNMPLNEFQPLTPGTYVWRVILSLQTTSGTEFVQSPIFGFKLVDPSDVNENLVRKAAARQVFNILRFLIGERANEIEDNLSDFSLSSIVVDGQKIELEELYNKINQYTDKVITIENIELLSSQE